METSGWLLLAGAGALLLSLLVLRRHAKNRRLPPGPPAVPLLGNLLLLRNSAAADVEPLLLKLFKRYGPIVTLRMGSGVTIFVADRHLAHAALVGHGAVAMANRPRAADGGSDYSITLADYGPVWRLLRRNLVAETLHPSRVSQFAPARAWARGLLMDKLRAAGAGDDGDEPGDVAETFRYTMFCLLVLMCFGERLDEAAVRAIEDAQRAWLLYASQQMNLFLIFVPSVTRRVFRGGRLRALQRRQAELFVPLINARREYKRRQAKDGQQVPRRETTVEHSYVDTLLDIRLPEEDHRALTDVEIVKLCSEFLTASTDTVCTALQWIMAELVKNPAVQDRLHAEIKATCGDDDDAEAVSEEAVQEMPYLKAVILEGLRKHPPGHFVLPHKAAEDVDVGGYLIPKGATVNFMVAMMGRDDKEWERPMEFAPERFLERGDGDGVDVTGSKRIRMMPFGVGRRICAGMTIAMLHLHYFVANMVREFEWKEAPGHEVELEEKTEFTTVMKKPLRPRLVPRRTGA